MASITHKNSTNKWRNSMSKFNFSNLTSDDKLFQKGRTGRNFRKRYVQENGGEWTNESGVWIHSSAKKVKPVVKEQKTEKKTFSWGK